MAMLTFKQFVTELAREYIVISPSEIEEMKHRFGAKVLQMGHLNEDGSMNVPVDCIVEAARSLETRALVKPPKSSTTSTSYPCFNPVNRWSNELVKPESEN